MTEKTFVEQFPSLEGFKLNKSLNIDVDYDLFSSTDIQQHCLDKQKVKDIIVKFQDNIFNIGEMSKEDRAKLTIKFDILNDQLGL